MKNFLFILFHLFQNLFNNISRHLYWLYRLSRCKIGRGVKIDYPIIVEGRGKFEFGINTKIGKRVNLGAAEGAKIEFQQGTVIGEGFYLRGGKETILRFGENCKLGSGTTIYTNSNWEIGNSVTIASNCSLFAREPGKNGELIIGNDSYIGDNTIVDLTDRVQIGKTVAIGPNCTLYTHDHDYKNAGENAAWKSAVISKPIVIKEGAWIGSNVTILPGVTIGKNAVVASGAVVTKSITEYTTVAGIPAKIIER